MTRSRSNALLIGYEQIADVRKITGISRMRGLPHIGMTGSPSYRQVLRHTGRELPVSHDAVALAQRHWTRVLR